MRRLVRLLTGSGWLLVGGFTLLILAALAVLAWS